MSSHAFPWISDELQTPPWKSVTPTEEANRMTGPTGKEARVFKPQTVEWARAGDTLTPGSVWLTQDRGVKPMLGLEV